MLGSRSHPPLRLHARFAVAALSAITGGTGVGHHSPTYLTWAAPDEYSSRTDKS